MREGGIRGEKLRPWQGGFVVYAGNGRVAKTASRVLDAGRGSARGGRWADAKNGCVEAGHGDVLGSLVKKFGC